MKAVAHYAHFYPWILVFLIPVCMSACLDPFEDGPPDHNGAPPAQIEYLFTRALLDAGFRIEYQDGNNVIYESLVPWTQVLGSAGNGPEMMRGNPMWIDDHWETYYTKRMMPWKQIDRLYESLSPTEQADYDIYRWIGSIVKAYATSMATDLWGAMPYRDALGTGSDNTEIYPSYDSQEDIYRDLLDQLIVSTGKIGGVTLNDSKPHQVLQKQDILLHGDLDRWQRFGNSLRLRLAMRLSEADPDLAELHVWQIFRDEVPLVENNDQNILLESVAPDGTASDAFNLATMVSGSKTFAGEVMMDMMKASGDPRIPVYFEPSYTGTYAGIPSSPDAQEDLRMSKSNFAVLNEDFFERNQWFPGVVVSAAEVSFLRAEACLRGWATGDAQTAYEFGLAQSVEMYYRIANLKSNMPYPDEAALHTFMASGPAAFDHTLGQVATQKWIHFFIAQPYEAFAEIRRTDYPALPEDTHNGSVLPRAVRLVYPPSEMANNPELYQDVKAGDRYDRRVWWDVR